MEILITEMKKKSLNNFKIIFEIKLSVNLLVDF